MCDDEDMMRMEEEENNHVAAAVFLSQEDEDDDVEEEDDNPNNNNLSMDEANDRRDDGDGAESPVLDRRHLPAHDNANEDHCSVNQEDIPPPHEARLRSSPSALVSPERKLFHSRR
jgi:hypothetical protein